MPLNNQKTKRILKYVIIIIAIILLLVFLLHQCVSSILPKDPNNAYENYTAEDFEGYISIMLNVEIEFEQAPEIDANRNAVLGDGDVRIAVRISSTLCKTIAENSSLSFDYDPSDPRFVSERVLVESNPIESAMIEALQNENVLVGYRNDYYDNYGELDFIAVENGYTYWSANYTICIINLDTCMLYYRESDM